MDAAPDTSPPLTLEAQVALNTALRIQFYKLWARVRVQLPQDWRRHPAAEQAAWLMFLQLRKEP